MLQSVKRIHKYKLGPIVNCNKIKAIKSKYMGGDFHSATGPSLQAKNGLGADGQVPEIVGGEAACG